MRAADEAGDCAGGDEKGLTTKRHEGYKKEEVDEPGWCLLPWINPFRSRMTGWMDNGVCELCGG